MSGRDGSRVDVRERCVRNGCQCFKKGCQEEISQELVSGRDVSGMGVMDRCIRNWCEGEMCKDGRHIEMCQECMSNGDIWDEVPMSQRTCSYKRSVGTHARNVYAVKYRNLRANTSSR